MGASAVGRVDFYGSPNDNGKYATYQDVESARMLVTQLMGIQCYEMIARNK